MLISLKSEISGLRWCLGLVVVTCVMTFCTVSNFRFRLNLRETGSCLRPPSLFALFASNLQPPLKWRPEMHKTEVRTSDVDKLEVDKAKIRTSKAGKPNAGTSQTVMETMIRCGGQHPVLLSTIRRPPSRTPEEPYKVVPNVVHYVFIGVARNFSFFEYLSFLSVEKFQKPDHIFLHGDVIPEGLWWYRAIQEVPNIYHVWTSPPYEIFGRKLTCIEHKADVMRYAIIYDYGGIYLDSDVLLLKSLNPLLKYPLTLGRVDGSRTEIANGVILARSRSDFLRLWALTYATYGHHNQYDYHSVRIPAFLERLYPFLVHVENNSLIRPHPMNQDELLRGHYNWSTQFTCHVWHRRRDALTYIPNDLTQMERLDTALGEIMRHVYHSPG